MPLRPHSSLAGHINCVVVSHNHMPRSAGISFERPITSFPTSSSVVVHAGIVKMLVYSYHPLSILVAISLNCNPSCSLALLSDESNICHFICILEATLLHHWRTGSEPPFDFLYCTTTSNCYATFDLDTTSSQPDSFFSAWIYS